MGWVVAPARGFSRTRFAYSCLQVRENVRSTAYHVRRMA